MGEYEKTIEMISYLEDVNEYLRNELAQGVSEEKYDEILEAVYENEIRIGELNGYLEELASMDGYSSYEDLLLSCIYDSVYGEV
jgi:hypothetical protein